MLVIRSDAFIAAITKMFYELKGGEGAFICLVYLPENSIIKHMLFY